MTKEKTDYRKAGAEAIQRLWDHEPGVMTLEDSDEFIEGALERLEALADEANG